MKLEYKHQEQHQIVQTSSWTPDAISYEEGAREKSTLFSPSEPTFDFLLPEHRYLSKKSNERAPVQFWMEIIAYRLGCLFGVAVPPAFVSINEFGDCRALIEWFYKDGTQFVSYTPGYTILRGIDPDMDKEKGTRHCLDSIYEAIKKVTTVRESVRKKILSSALTKAEKRSINSLFSSLSLIDDFSKMFTFDALIANTDRHHENWGVVMDANAIEEGHKSSLFSLSPAFDNGTSLGYNFLENKLATYMQAPGWFENYANKGTHQLRCIAGGRCFKHDELIEVLLETRSDCFSLVEELVSFDMDDVRAILNELVKFDVKVPFTEQRAEFTAKIIEAKRNALVRVLEKCSQKTE